MPLTLCLSSLYVSLAQGLDEFKEEFAIPKLFKMKFEVHVKS